MTKTSVLEGFATRMEDINLHGLDLRVLRAQINFEFAYCIHNGSVLILAFKKTRHKKKNNHRILSLLLMKTLVIFTYN